MIYQVVSWAKGCGCWRAECRYGAGVIRVFLSLDSRGGALEILIRWVPGLWNVKRFLAQARALGARLGGGGIRACLPYLAYKAKASQLYVLIMLVV